jgi:hypothetical protein
VLLRIVGYLLRCLVQAPLSFLGSRELVVVITTVVAITAVTATITGDRVAYGIAGL